MADILSQNEVDALLSAISNGEVESSEEGHAPEEGDSGASGSIYRYDFRRPDIVSKDQLRTLQMLHKTFCRYLTTNLSTFIRSIVEVNLVAVDQLTYGEFNLSLSNPTCINVFSIAPLEGRAVLEINPVLVFSIIDRLLGGQGEPPATVRPLTDIEQSIISKVIDLFLAGFREAWQNIVKFDLKVEERETNPQFVQVVAPGETVILISCEVKMAQVSGILTVCLPFVYIEPIMSSLSAQHWISSTQKAPTEDMKHSLRARLDQSKLDCRVVLGRSRLSIRELLDLKRGDVVPLDQKVNRPLEVYVKGRKRFLGKPGVSGKNRAVQVTGKFKDY
jgi:flagellar motor switch protein FliM